MAMRSFRDRFFTPQVARAITSPSGIVLAGVGTAAAILAVGVTPVAALAGLAAWAARVAMAIPRSGRPGEAIDPFRVGDPWRRFVVDAQQAKRRFDETVRRCRPGPVRDRLSSVGERMNDAVTECWRNARHGDQLDGALRTLDPDTIRAELEEVHAERRRVEGDEQAAAALSRTQQAIESQLESARRLRGVASDAQNRLRLLNAQLDEAVARSVEISLSAGDVSELGSLTNDVENVVGDLEALRAALEETSSVAGGTGGTTVAGTS